MTQACSARAITSVLCLAAILAACTPDRPQDPTVNQQGQAAKTAGPAAVAAPAPPPAARVDLRVASPALAIDGEGLRLFDRDSGSARALPFGMARAATLAALPFRGPPAMGTQTECGAGELNYASWADGLKLYFQRGKFAGWAVDGRGKGSVTTAAGIGVGSSRAELRNAYAATFSKTSLGTEFVAGALSGLLDGPAATARISDLWAGVSCNFR